MRYLACWLVCLLVIADVQGAAPIPARYDANGVRLPLGARLRLGTARWRLMNGGRRCLSPDRKVVVWNEDEAIQLTDSRTGRTLFRMPREDVVQHPLAISHDGKSLALVQESGTLSLWRIGSGERPTTMQVDKDWNYHHATAVFLPGDRQLAIWRLGECPELSVWDLTTGKRLRRDRLRAVRGFGSFSPDGRRFAGCVVLTDLVTGRWRRIRMPPEEGFGLEKGTHLEWSPDGKRLALSASHQILIHDPTTGRLLHTLPVTDYNVPPFALSPDGRTLAMENGSLQIRDIATGKVVRELKAEYANSGNLMDIFYSDGDHLTVLEFDGYVKTWNVRTGKEVSSGEGHRSDVTGLAFLADGRTLVSMGNDRIVRRWDTRTGKHLAVMRNPGIHHGQFLSISACGRFAAVTETTGGDVTTLDLQKKHVLWRDVAIAYATRSIEAGLSEEGCRLSPDGSRLAMSAPVYSANGKSWACLEVWSPTGRLEQRVDFRAYTRQAFAPDSKSLAVWIVGEKSSEVRRIDLETGKAMWTAEVGKSGKWPTATVLAFSPGGRILAGANDTEAYLWESCSGALLGSVNLPRSFIPIQVVVTPDDRVLFLGHLYQSIFGPFQKAVWDMQANKILRTTRATWPHAPVALSPDGRTLAIGCDDSSILLYDVPQPPATKQPPTADVKRLWADLASRDARRAWRAQEQMIASPVKSLAALERHLRPTRFQQSPMELADLDSDEYTARQSAVKTLAHSLKRGDRHTELSLGELLRSNPPLEVYLRAERLLSQAPSHAYTTEESRQIRAIAVLERIASKDARALLKRLADGGLGVQTAQAKEALKRVECR